MSEIPRFTLSMWNFEYFLSRIIRVWLFWVGIDVAIRCGDAVGDDYSGQVRGMLHGLDA